MKHRFNSSKKTTKIEINSFGKLAGKVGIEKTQAFNWHFNIVFAHLLHFNLSRIFDLI